MTWSELFCRLKTLQHSWLHGIQPGAVGASLLKLPATLDLDVEISQTLLGIIEYNLTCNICTLS